MENCQKNETASLLLYLSDQQVSLDFMMVHVPDSWSAELPKWHAHSKRIVMFSFHGDEKHLR